VLLSDSNGVSLESTSCLTTSVRGRAAARCTLCAARGPKPPSGTHNAAPRHRTSGAPSSADTSDARETSDVGGTHHRARRGWSPAGTRRLRTSSLWLTTQSCNGQRGTLGHAVAGSGWPRRTNATGGGVSIKYFLSFGPRPHVFPEWVACSRARRRARAPPHCFAACIPAAPRGAVSARRGWRAWRAAAVVVVNCRACCVAARIVP
jgi:hypothetical protein